jgi:hypothetical protein
MAVHPRRFWVSKFLKLVQHVRCNNIRVPEKYGFRKGISTEDTTYKLTDNVLKSINQKMHVGGIFCDLDFDCVSNEIF